jgi:hypothetical protein
VDVVFGYLVMFALAGCMCAFDERLLAPRRSREIAARIEAMSGGQRPLAQLAGVESGGEDGPDFDYVFAATEAGLTRCYRRRGACLLSERWASNTLLWSEARLRVGKIDTDGTGTVWVNDERASGDIVAVVAAGQSGLTDPSGLIGVTVAACKGEALQAVLHGVSAGDAYPGSSALLACSDTGIVVTERTKVPPKYRRRWVMATRIIPWSERPVARIVPGPLPGVIVEWSAGSVEVCSVVLGDVVEFASATFFRGRHLRSQPCEPSSGMATKQA